jgi:glycosyltransferase involved in cell wall biosynthesis
MSAPDVSVIIPTRNRAPLVRRAVQSALAAARRGDEIIVVDDGSTDETARSLDAYVDRIRYVRSAQVGPGAARNLGIREARSDLVAFLDSDDEWMPDKLALQRALMCTSTVLVRRQEAGERGLPGGARLAAGLRIRRDRRRAARLRAQVSGARSGRHAVGRRRGRSRAEGIQVGASYPGNIYRAIQQAARRMHEDGVLLALNSLNNEGDVWQAFELSRPRFSSSAISRRLSALSRQLIRQAEKCAARGPGPSAATPDCPGSHPAAVV